MLASVTTKYIDKGTLCDRSVIRPVWQSWIGSHFYWNAQLTTHKTENQQQCNTQNKGRWERACEYNYRTYTTSYLPLLYLSEYSQQYSSVMVLKLVMGIHSSESTIGHIRAENHMSIVTLISDL